MDLEARVSELSVELDQSRAEREQYRKLYLEMLERCALLERGLIAGKKAERFTGNDGQLTLMVLGQVLAPESPESPQHPESAQPPEAEETAQEPKAAPRGAARRGPARRGPLPSELPRIEIEVLPPEVQREGLDAFVRIGQEVSEVVEHRPASLVVVRIVRPRFLRKGHAQHDDSVGPSESGVLFADPPERPIVRGIAGPGLLAKTVVYRWQDHLPVYRQESIHARDGLELARSTICGWHQRDKAEEVAEVGPGLDAVELAAGQEGDEDRVDACPLVAAGLQAPPPALQEWG